MKPALNVSHTEENAASVKESKVTTEVAAIWKEVLGVPDIDPEKRFFEQGGNSINAIVIMSRMKKAGYPVTLRDIIHHQTIRKMTQELWQPSAINLVDTCASLEDFIHHKSGITVSCKTIHVRYNDDVSELHILFTEPDKTATVQQLISESVQQIAPAVLPHYISGGGSFDGTTASFQAAEFYSMLGLQPLQSFDVTAAQALIHETFHVNDEAISNTVVLQQYPLCAMQQLQIFFHTPACVDYLLLNTYVDVPTLQQVYSILIKRHSLLRSVAVNEGNCYNWEEYAFDPTIVPAIPLIDLAGYQCSPADFQHLATSLVFRKYEPGKIFHQFVLFRVNLKEYYLVMIFSHVIFDRVTGEVLKNQLLNYYQDLMDKKKVRTEKIVPFETYVNAIGKGPQDIAEQEVIGTFQLEEFYNAKQQIRKSIHGSESQLSYSFSIEVSLQDTVQQQDILATTLAIYTRALHRYLGTAQIPLLFVCDGRQYENKLYYNTIGEFTDMVPMLTDGRWSVAETGEAVSRRLTNLKKHNLNFLHQLLLPASKPGWPEIRRLMDAGEGFAHFDILMFNFLGNADEIPEAATAQVNTEPNPLPINSLLNCIASASTTEGRIIFRFRSSYTIDIGQLRELFAVATQEILH
ncbi:condensation domain-containing protein [Chitinophaga sancti]|uniref:Condensation domain-containing protein n=1 Tax=Chitinophaga sancti TaxID=1004 RepID=A0A1K1SC35_9BACT|nr:condensation domain-containing protein [Chitinophaga sancti]WQD63594.1 condensation domain-containing protein [Chitinophaga sancti]WQG90780.1 condensation domain-containing protein [Chitinophaga sancti]SFW81929.1 Phosphopantetheine attachment site [Chitinophaga sancti]